jgi:cytochrome c
MRRKQITIAILAGAMSAALGLGAPKDVNRARVAFEKRCTGCHALDSIKVGPRLRGVYGRQAGKDAGFSYSDAMMAASVIWDEKTLDRWLTDTDSVIRGNDMSFRLDDAAERSDIIAYLKEVSGK